MKASIQLPLLYSRRGEPTGERDGDHGEHICNGSSEKSESQNKAYFSGRRNTVHAAHPVHILRSADAEYRTASAVVSVVS